MRKRLFNRCSAHSFKWHFTKGSAGRGKNQPLDFVWLLTAHALMECVVLAVDWQQLRSRLRSRADHQLARHHQSFLVGKTDAATKRQSLVSWNEADSADCRRNDNVYAIKRRYIDQTLGAKSDFRKGVNFYGLQLLFKLCDVTLFRNRDKYRTKASNLLSQSIEIATGSEPAHREPV